MAYREEIEEYDYKILEVLEGRADSRSPCPTNLEMSCIVGCSLSRVSHGFYQLTRDGFITLEMAGNVRRAIFPDGRKTDWTHHKRNGHRSERKDSGRKLRLTMTKPKKYNPKNGRLNTNLQEPSLPAPTIENTSLLEAWHAAHERAHAALEEEIEAGLYD